MMKRSTWFLLGLLLAVALAAGAQVSGLRRHDHTSASQGGVLALGGTLTSKTTLSGTSIDITGIPSGVKMIAVRIVDGSTSAGANPYIQLGDSGGIETTGYDARGTYTPAGSATTSTSYTDGCGHRFALAAATYDIQTIFTLHDASTNEWIGAGHGAGNSGDNATGHMTCQKALSAELTQIRITTQGGTNTFDSGTVSVTYWK